MVRRAVAELLGTAFLLAAIVGSGMMAERLAAGNVAMMLLANTMATGAALIALILAVGPVSGAHLNPVVILGQACAGALPWSEVPVYGISQIVGAYLGVAIANMMFGYKPFFVSHRVCAGLPQIISEFVATFGLILVIWSCSRFRPFATPFAVGTYIVAAYWFTASTSFANPAVTLARAASDTFAGIRPADVPGYLASQFTGGLAAVLLCGWLLPSPRKEDTPQLEH